MDIMTRHIKKPGRIKAIWQKISNDLSSFITDHIYVISASVLLLVFPSYQYFDLENRFYDIQMKIRYILHKTDVSQTKYFDATVVTIDDQAVRMSSRELLNSSTDITSRKYLSLLLDRIMTRKPKLIAIDLLLDEAWKNKDDRSLAESLRKLSVLNIPVVLASRLTTNQLAAPVLPLPIFLDAFKQSNNIYIGHINLDTYRADDVVRDHRPARKISAKDALFMHRYLIPKGDIYYYNKLPDGYYSFSFSTQIALAITVQSKENKTKSLEKLTGSDHFFIDFSGNYGDVNKIISSNIIADDFPDGMLRDKIVVIATDYSRRSDRIKTPLSIQSNIIPGVTLFDKLTNDLIGGMVHVYSYKTLMSYINGGLTIQKINDWYLVVILLFIVLTLYKVYLSKRYSYIFLKFAIFTAIYYAIHTVAFQAYEIYLPLVRPLGGILMLMALRHIISRLNTNPADGD